MVAKQDTQATGMFALTTTQNLVQWNETQHLLRFLEKKNIQVGKID
jgi:hypothetical protein